MNDYTGEQIEVLKGLEAVRKRPACTSATRPSAGSTSWSTKPSTMPSTRRWPATRARIAVVLYKDGSVSVEDDGRGIPIDMIAEEKLPAVEVVMTILHAGGKFGKGGYKVSGGLHGVGISVVNALSEWMITRVHRDGWE